MASIIKADTLQSTTANVFVLNSSGTEYARFDSTGVFQLTNPTTFPAGTAAAPSITATGDTNTGLYFPAADTIAFTEGGVEAMRIDSSGRLLLGTTSTTTSSSQSGEVYSSGAAGFLLTNTTAANFGLSVKNQGTSGTRNLINFLEGTGGGTARANISFDGSNSLTFSTAGIARISIPIDAGGITFPATQSASSDANTLDDYEEGTWTPAITGSTTVGSASYTARNGTYVKIGTYVYFACDIQSSSTPTGTGILFITGLPYTSINNQFCMSLGLPYWNGTARAFTSLGGYADGSTTRIVMIGTLGAATGISYMNPADLPSGSRIFFAGIYQTQN
jgi:hypothetical protein